MMKQLILGATLAAATLASTPLLADPMGQHCGRNTSTSAANCPAAGAEHGQHAMRHGGMHGQHAMGHGGMHGQRHAARGEGHRKGAHDAHGTQRGGAGADCPMHNERKPT